MSCLSSAPQRALQAIIPIDPPPSKREKVARYLQQKKEQFDTYQRLLNQQRQSLINQREAQAQDNQRKRTGSSTTVRNARFSRMLSSTSFTSFAKAQQQEEHSSANLNSSNIHVESDTYTHNNNNSQMPDGGDGEKLLMFPSYARRLDTGLVEIDIRGWVFAPGTPNRKNKLFTSVVRQLVGVPTSIPDTVNVADAGNRGLDRGSDSTESSINKNNSSTSINSLMSNDREFPSTSRKGLVTNYNASGIRSDSPGRPSTSAMNIPQSSGSLPKNGGRLSSPSSPRYGTSFGTSPRSSIYSSTMQSRRVPDTSGSVINRNNFVQPTLGGERQPLLNNVNNNRSYLINISDSESDDYSDDDDDDEVIDNHHETFVVERRQSSIDGNSDGSRLKHTPSATNVKRTKSIYSMVRSGSVTSIMGHNSEVIAANDTNAPLSSSPVASNMNAYFPVLGRNNSTFNLSRSFSVNNYGSPTSSALNVLPRESPMKKKKIKQVPPPLPPRPKLISFSSMYNAEKSLQERIAPFISRPISQAGITIHVGSTETEEYSTYSVVTTDSGHFGVRLRLMYEPAIACVECGEGLIAVEEVKVIEPYGVSLISDIDDTIKHTGITGAKKGIFKNVFVKDYSELEIKGVSEWYQRLNKLGVPFHYVSNSPWQLFPSISKFLRKAGLPSGSMHLKHYNGFLYGLLEPAVERKRFNLESILFDFPLRKFILVGDSGEMDLEAYVNLACQFPNQVVAIYIRDVTTICSDDDEFCTISEWNGFFSSSVPKPDEIDDLLEDDTVWCCSAQKDEGKYYNRPHSPPPLMPKPEGLRSSKITTTAPGPTSIDWSSIPERDKENDSERPKVPKKPESLKSQSLTLHHPVPLPPSANVDLLSSSAGSMVSPLAQRLAAFSSTFDESGTSPERNGGYMSMRNQDQNMANKQSAKADLAKTGLDSFSKLSLPSKSFGGLNTTKVTGPENNNRNKSVDTPVVSSHLRSAARTAAGIAATGVSGTIDKEHVSDVVSFAYRACIGVKNGSNRDGYPMDKKLEMWKKRVARARMMLPNGIRLRMWRVGDDIADECVAVAEEYLGSSR
ncbi:hypothetical protein V1514DRAFT_299958 [Lipomyces japonicus]|uniref:uncharacterized protein n=1 Tax=Lipomyces japonicus TaxID=56871 RepID=UPI0034CE9C00